MTGPNPISGLKRMYARSRRWPVRSRIAIVSAVLTAVILIAFALVVGRLVSNRLHADFENDLQANAADARERQVPARHERRGDAAGSEHRRDPAHQRCPDPGAEDGRLRRLSARNVPDLGPPDPGSVVEVGGLEVASAQVFSTALGSIVAYVQYARPESSVNATIGRLWLFLAGGVAIGTILAGIAGMAVANRAMRPIAALTAAAGEIATTRDTSRRIPEPESDDEVAELAAHARSDASRARRRAIRDREHDQAAARVRRRRLPRAAHPTDQHSRQPRAAGGLAEHDGPDADEDETAAVASALRSSKRMNRLVGDLLLLARADAGRVGRARRVRSGADRIRGAGRGRAGLRRAPVHQPIVGSAPVAGQSGRAPSHGPQPARERGPPHPGGHRDRPRAQRGGGSRPPAGQRRRPGPAGRDGVAGLRSVRPRPGTRRSDLPQRHRHRPRPLDRASRRASLTAARSPLAAASRGAPPSTSRCRCRAPEKFERTLPRH